MELTLSAHRARASCGGYASGIALRVFLLLLVLGQVVFLASRHRARVDLTADRLYSLTESTRNVLAGLDDRLLVECYFSKESRLPTAYRELRRQLENFLDEYVQLSDGKIVLQKFDPQDDSMVAEKAERLGIRRLTMTDTGDDAFSIKELWQGMRLLYGAEKQEVIDFFNFQLATAMYEAELTPKIKALTVKKKPKIGVLAFATEAGGGGPFGGGSQPKGYTRLGEIEGVKGRYELQNLDLSQGQLVPDDVGTLLLVRPKNLTDRQKYALDQFLMRGGNLVVFADTFEYEIGEQRSFRGRKVNYDATDAKLKFLDQLAHYGAKVEDKLVADMLDLASQQVSFPVIRRDMFNRLVAMPFPYPYWFQPLDINYAEQASSFVLRDAAPTGNTAELVQRYRDLFKPGMDKEHSVLKSMRFGPPMFWPCPVAIADKLPEGVTGRVLLRTSPLSFLEDPPVDANPLGWNPNDLRQQNDALRAFQRKSHERLMSEPRQQFGLMAELSGTFSSFFEGKEIPPRRREDDKSAATGALGADPLREAIQSSPVQPPPAPVDVAPGEVPTAAPKTEEAGAGAGKAAGETAPAGQAEPKANEPQGQQPEVPKKPGEGTGSSGNGGDGGSGQEPSKQEPPAQEPVKSEGAAATPAAQEPVAPKANEPQPAAQEPGAEKPPSPEPAAAPEPVGPPAPPAPAPTEDKDPPPIYKAEKPGRLIVIGDADNVRDDLIQGEYLQAGGPVSQLGPAFIGNLLDSIAEDQDLLALRNKTVPDRKLSFAARGTGPAEDLAETEAQAKRTADLARWGNVIGPCAAIMVVWLIIGLRRRARKQMFLSSVQG